MDPTSHVTFSAIHAVKVIKSSIMGGENKGRVERMTKMPLDKWKYKQFACLVLQRLVGLWIDKQYISPISESV